MPIRSVLRMGDPVLLQKAAPVEHFDTPELHALVRDMEDTMRYMEGAGIAEPQIGVVLNETMQRVRSLIEQVVIIHAD